MFVCFFFFFRIFFLVSPLPLRLSLVYSLCTLGCALLCLFIYFLTYQKTKVRECRKNEKVGWIVLCQNRAKTVYQTDPRIRHCPVFYLGIGSGHYCLFQVIRLPPKNVKYPVVIFLFEGEPTQFGLVNLSTRRCPFDLYNIPRLGAFFKILNNTSNNVPMGNRRSLQELTNNTDCIWNVSPSNSKVIQLPN